MFVFKKNLIGIYSKMGFSLIFLFFNNICRFFLILFILSDVVESIIYIIS